VRHGCGPQCGTSTKTRTLERDEGDAAGDFEPCCEERCQGPASGTGVLVHGCAVVCPCECDVFCLCNAGSAAGVAAANPYGCCS
jgi:hypothetical protein